MLLCRSVGKSILSPGVASGLVKVGRERGEGERGFLSNKTSPTKVTTLSSSLAGVLFVQNNRVTAGHVADVASPCRSTQHSYLFGP